MSELHLPIACIITGLVPIAMSVDAPPILRLCSPTLSSSPHPASLYLFLILDLRKWSLIGRLVLWFLNSGVCFLSRFFTGSFLNSV